MKILKASITSSNGGKSGFGLCVFAPSTSVLPSIGGGCGNLEGMS